MNFWCFPVCVFDATHFQNWPGIWKFVVWVWFKCHLIFRHLSSISFIEQPQNWLNFFSCFVRPSFQFTPSIRPCLQTIAIGLVAFGENYRRHHSGLGQHRLFYSCIHSSCSCLILFQILYPNPCFSTLLHGWRHLLDVVFLDCRCSFILWGHDWYLVCFSIFHNVLNFLSYG